MTANLIADVIVNGFLSVLAIGILIEIAIVAVLGITELYEFIEDLV